MDTTTEAMVIAEIDNQIASNVSFTAFDITKQMRAAGYPVLHYEVRDVVHRSMDARVQPKWNKEIDNSIPGQPWRYSPDLPQPTLSGQPVFIAKGPASNLNKDIINNSTDVEVNGQPVVKRIFDNNSKIGFTTPPPQPVLDSIYKGLGVANPNPSINEQIQNKMNDPNVKVTDLKLKSRPSNVNTQPKGKVLSRSNRGRLWVNIDKAKVVASSLNSIKPQDIKEVAIMEGVNELQIIYPPFQVASKTYTVDQQRNGVKISKQLLDRVFGNLVNKFAVQENNDGLVLTRV